MGSRKFFARLHYFVDETVFFGFCRAHVVVAIGVELDLFVSFSRVLGEDMDKAFFELIHKLHRAFDITGRAGSSATDLMDHDIGIGEGKAFSVSPGGEEDRTHAGGHSDAVGIYRASHELHGVINSQSSGHRSPRGVDVDADIFFPVIHLEEKELGDYGIGDMVIDGRSDEDNSILKESGIDIVGLLAVAATFDDEGHRIVVILGGNDIAVGLDDHSFRSERVSGISRNYS